MSEEEEKKLEQKRKCFTVAGYEATGAGGKEGGNHGIEWDGSRGLCLFILELIILCYARSFREKSL